MKHYSIHVELEYATDGDPFDRAHEILRLITGFAARAEHYHLLGKPRELDETDEETRDEEARRTEEDAQP